MLVRVNYGWKAGQVQDIDPVAARAMLKDGRASVVDFSSGLQSVSLEGVAKLCTKPEEAKPEDADDKGETKAKSRRK